MSLCPRFLGPPRMIILSWGSSDWLLYLDGDVCVSAHSLPAIRAIHQLGSSRH